MHEKVKKKHECTRQLYLKQLAWGLLVWLFKITVHCLSPCGNGEIFSKDIAFLVLIGFGGGLILLR